MPDRYKSEIEEILKQADDVLSKEDTPRRKGHNGQRGKLSVPMPLGISSFKISPSRIMVTGIALFLVALILLPLGITSSPLIWAGLTLFVIAYALFFIRPGGSGGYEKRWRGRIIDEQSPLSERLKRWFKG